jgi:RHS repeat-associated protein
MPEFVWRRRRDCVAHVSLDPHHNFAAGLFRLQYLLFLAALIMLAGLTQGQTGAAPPAYQYYILNPRIQNAPLQVMSLADGNRIRVDSVELSLNRHERATITAGTDLAPGTLFTGNGPFTLASETGGTDLPVPGRFAGTEFVIPHYRNHHQYHLLSPRGDAQVEILLPTGPQHLDLPEGEVVVYDAGSDNTSAGILRSDRPILVEHSAFSGSSPRDVYPVPPAARELLGIRSQTAVVAALENDTRIQAYASDGSHTEYHLNAGQMEKAIIGANGAQGGGDALRIVADKPVAAIQVADGDGVEATAFLSTAYLGTHHGIPVDTQYLALACPERYTRVTLHLINGEVETQYCASSGYGLTPGVAHFGSTVSGAHIPAGSYLESDLPVYLYHEAQLSEAEHNLLGEGFDYFLLDDRSQQAPLSVYSLVENNRIQAGDYSQWLSRHSRQEIPAGSNLAAGTRITGGGPLFLGSPLPGTDQPVPAVLAGMEFVIPHYRNRHVYSLLSPYGDARAEIRIGGILETIDLPQDQVVEFEAGESNGLAGIVEASRPILLQHTAYDGENPVDVYPVPPADHALWGIRSHIAVVGALHDATSVEVHASNGDTEIHVLNAGETREIDTGFGGAQGTGNALHISADKPVAAIQIDDGDGLEGTAFLGASHLGTRYVVPVDTQYIAVVCPESDTRIKITFMDGMSPTFHSQTCSGNGPIPGKAYLGSTSEGAHIPAGAYLESGKPVHLVYEAAATNGERNLLGYSGSPNMTIVSPKDGGFTNQTRPVVRVELSGHDIDFSTNTLQMHANEQQLDASCHYEADFAECTPDNPLATGYVRLKMVLHAPTGQPLEVDQVEFTVDTTPPLMNLYSPEDGSWVNTAELLVRGQMSEPGTATINGTEVGLYGKYNFQHSLVLQEGANDIQIRATDRAGNENNLGLTVYLDSIAPEAVDSTVIQITDPAGGMTSITGEAGSAEPESTIHLINLDNGESASAAVDAEGGFSVAVMANPGDRIAITVLDRAGNSSETREFQVPDGTQEPLPPDPATVAPPLDPTVATTMFAATGFLYTGPNPIQQGVAPGTIEERRVAVIRGQVKTRGGAPLSGVRVTIKDHGEYGHTLSRADGLFDLAVNGGGWITVRYERDGYLPVQRQVEAPWQDYAWLPEVVMVGLDPQVTHVDLTAATPIQTARGGSVTDSDGTRQATVLFPQGTQAEMVLPDGTTQPLGTLNVRATEYTVGESGPASMPGELPPTSGYTYAVELSVDEAIAAGAREVRFDRPVPFYLENFLGFPVGGIVPAGWYDRERAAWIPSDNGRIIQILSISGDLAEVDVDGSGTPATDAALVELGISEDERRELALLYDPGQSLWRVPVEHFTPWDCNWPAGPPADGIRPGEGDQDLPDVQTDDQEDKPNEDCGSIIECQNQLMGQRVPVTGTPFTLNYRSDRVPGRKAAYTLDIPLSGATLPDSLKRIDLRITIAGRNFMQSFPAEADQHHRFTWDGRDAFGREVHGTQRATIRLGYVYPAVFYEPADFVRSFSRTGGSGISGNRSASEITLWRDSASPIGSARTLSAGLGGWDLSISHAFIEGILYRGDGSKRKIQGGIRTVAGGSTGGDGIPATESYLQTPMAIALAPDGSLYVANATGHNVRRVGPDGIITTVAGTGLHSGPIGDGGPATEAAVPHPYAVALGPDGDLYIATNGLHDYRIRKVDMNGIITTVAGIGQAGFGGDGGPATDAMIYHPYGLAAAQDGSIYIADLMNFRVRRVDPDGIISTVAGDGSGRFNGDGIPALEVGFMPKGIALGPDGSLYIADPSERRVFRVTPDGILATVAGTGTSGPRGDGGLAIEASLPSPDAVAVGPDGSLYIADGSDQLIRVVDPNGYIRTVVGNGVRGFSGENAYPTLASLNNPSGVGFGPDGALYIADMFNHRIRKVDASYIETGSVTVSSDDGRESFVFGDGFRHLRTLDTTTGALLYQFGYDPNGYLVGIVDGDGNMTRIEREADGTPLAIVSADDQRTVLALDPNGYLATITHPDGESHRMAYTEDGLLTSFTDPRDNASVYGYDSLGRLIETENAAGGGWTLSRTELTNGYESSMTTAEGRTTRYRVEQLSSGDKLRTNTHPDSTVEITRTAPGGQRTVTTPDGSTIELEEGADPRFGVNSPVPALRMIATPAGKLARITTERSATLAHSHDPLSHTELVETVSRNGRSFTSRYTAADRTWHHSSPAGREQTLVLDEQGRVTQQVQAGLAPMTYAYDARGRLEGMIQAPNTPRERRFALGYDEDGWLASVSDPLSRTLAYEYDAAGRVIRQTLPDGREIGYQYDPNGNLIALLPPGRDAHLFSYSPVNLEEQYTPPDLSGADTITRYQYNLDRQLTRIERPDGKTVALGYGLGGRLEQMTLARGQYRHDYHPATGQPIGITAPDGGTLAFGWDGFLPTSETWSGEVSGTVLRDYDNDFRLTDLDINGTSIAFGYDDDGLLTNAGDLSITRNSQHGLPTGTLLGSMATTRDYNEFGEPARDSAAMDNAPLLDITYTRDRLGRIQEITEMIDGVTTVHAYGYDLAGRLVTATRAGVTTSWTYDSNGNRTRVNGMQVASYDAQDRLLSHGTASYTYTANGELESKTEGGATTRYDYDELGNLLQVTLPGDITLDYMVDGRNRRIGKKVNGTLVQGFLYQDQLNPVAELDGEGNVTARFVYADKPHVPAYMIKEGITYRILSDHLGSPRLIVHAGTGEVVQRLDYDAWGNILTDTNPGIQPFGFAGGIYDQYTGLVRFGARDYDPENARWISKDPIRFDGNDANLYAYVGNNPLNYIDPHGLFLCSILQNLGDLTIDLNAGIGAGLGISGGLSLSSSGVTGNVTAGSGIGLGASAGISGTTNLSGINHSGGVGTAVTVSGGAGFGGSGSINAGTGGVSATGTIGVGFGFNITSGFSAYNQILDCEEEPDCK